jgi:hypothetical protein
VKEDVVPVGALDDCRFLKSDGVCKFGESETRREERIHLAASREPIRLQLRMTMMRSVVVFIARGLNDFEDPWEVCAA